MGRILAIDYGRKRVGLAVTDELQLIASALPTVSAAEVMRWIRQYVDKERVEGIVVGLPRQMNNTDSESAQFIEPFVRSLKKQFPTIPVYRVDERFTSKMATATLLEAGLKKKDRQNKSLVDAVSATLILQSFLQMRSGGFI